MESNNKVVAMAALVVAIITLGVGFAAFSSTLIVNNTANVNPTNTFKVEFSKSKSTTAIGDLEATVQLTEDTQKSGLSGKELVDLVSRASGTATLTESKIENLVANFTDPGQQVIFTFWIRNGGEYDAHLNSVVFEKLTGKEVKKECIAGTGATDSLVQAACAGINVEVVSSGLTANAAPYVLTDDATPGTILAKSIARQVKVAITYEYGSARADGPFTVKFGDIKFNFSTTA